MGGQFKGILIDMGMSEGWKWGYAMCIHTAASSTITHKIFRALMPRGVRARSVK